jgi:hypothetical protein
MDDYEYLKERIEVLEQVVSALAIERKLVIVHFGDKEWLYPYGDTGLVELRSM